VIHTFKTKIFHFIIISILGSSIYSQSLFLNEIMSKNESSLQDKDGEYVDWIEIFNGSDFTVNLEGYKLTDNPDLLSKWIFGPISIPADSFIIIYASDKNRNLLIDDLHTNFKIKSAGESIILSDQNDQIIDSVFTNVIPTDISKGRMPDGSNNWVFFQNSSPGESNLLDGVVEFKIIENPNFSIDGGFYDDPVKLDLSLSNNSDENIILYSLDGSEPSIVYSDTLFISKTTVVRSKVVNSNDGQTSKIETQTFFINENIDHSLPVFSIATNPSNFYGESGILEEENLVWGPNNALIDTEIPINIEMFEEDHGNLAFNHLAGCELFGSGSTYEPQKSLAIYFRSKYDVGELKYKLFENSPISEYEAFILRNSGNDMYASHFRDALTISLLDNNTNLDYQHYRPSIVFLNGEYYGILNIREKINEHYIEHHHFVSKENLDLLSYKEVEQPVIIHGDIQQYTDLLIYLHNKDLNDKDSYPHIAEIVDIENLIEYQIMEIYAGNIDWPGNNHKFWKSKYDGSKWRWILFDTDTGYGLWDEWWQDGRTGYKVNHFHHATSLGYEGGGWPNPPFSTYIFRKLIENESFKNQFINRFLDLLNTRLSSRNVINTIDSLTFKLQSSMPRHLERWDVWDDDLPEIYDYEVGKLKEFAINRPRFSKMHMKNFFNLNTEKTVKLNIIPKNSGSIIFNSLTIQDSVWNGSYYNNVPIKLVADPKPGFKFSGWSSNSLQSSNNELNIFPTDEELTAFFSPDSNGDIIINEINYSSFDIADSEDWIEIFNSTSEEIILNNWSLSDNSSESFTFPIDYSIGQNNYLIIAKDLDKFSKIYPNIKNVIGNFPFGLSSESDSIILKNQYGEIVDIVSYQPEHPWPIKVNDSGQTLELTNPILDNSFGDNWSLSKGYGTPGQRNSNYSFLNQTNSETSKLDSTLSSKIINYPNPFSDNTNIEFFSEKDGLVEIKIFNILGESIISLSKLNRPSGIYFDKWNGLDSFGREVSSGVYIIVMYIDSKVYASNKILIF